MPLHRTASSDALTTFATDILHDRDISWCAAGLSELEAAGYLRRVTGEGGGLGGPHVVVRYEVSDVRRK